MGGVHPEKRKSREPDLCLFTSEFMNAYLLEGGCCTVVKSAKSEARHSRLLIPQPAATKGTAWAKP